MKITGKKVQNNTLYFNLKCKIRLIYLYFYTNFFVFCQKILLTCPKNYDIISHDEIRKADKPMLKFTVANKKIGAMVSYSLFIFSFNI